MKDLKFLFVGLANAGKTSILKALDNDFESIPTLTPTTGVEYNTFRVMGFTIAAWDLGGQQKYRKKYLQEHERYFLETSAVFFIVDSQAPEEYKESIEYLSAIHGVLKSLKLETVPFSVLLHKFDPHMRSKDDPMAKEVPKLRDGLDKALGAAPHTFYETSVYEPHTLFRAFSETLLNYIPNREVIQSTLAAIANEFSSKMAILLDNSGYIYGQWHSKEAQLLQLSKFNRMTQEFSRLMSPHTYSEFTLLNLDDIADVGLALFKVGEELFMVGIAVPHAWLEQDNLMADNFVKRKNDLIKVLKVFM